MSRPVLVGLHLGGLLFFTACGDPQAADTGEDVPFVEPDTVGPYSVGVLTLAFTDSRGKSLEAEVWYPAILADGDEPTPYPEIPISRNAVREPSPDLRGAPYPLVAFSHGYGGIRYQSVFLTEHLASHGFVIVAVDHPHNTLLDLDGSQDVQVMLERPDDVRASVDHLVAQAETEHVRLGGMVEDGEYTIIGHSFGAFTAMMLGGGTVDFSSVADHCALDDSGPACGWVEDGSVLPAESHGFGDERVVATIPMSPGVWYAFGAEGAGLADVRLPLVLGGTKDTVLDYEGEILPCYQAMAAPKRMATLADAGHYAFSDICSVLPLLFDDCQEEEGGFIDIERAHLITQTLVTAFLGSQVLGDERYEPWLESSYTLSVAELDWEESLP